MRVIALLLLTSAVACAQQDDLAAAARANQQQQKPAPATKVYTNDDLGAADVHGDEKPAAATDKEIAKLPRDKQDRARQMVKQILQQRAQIAKIQAHLDKLQAIQADRDQLKTPPPMTTQQCADEPERCETRREFANDLGRTERQLTAAKKKLDDLQDSARKAGYPPGVFDPAE
jgi:hypothetical protein